MFIRPVTMNDHAAVLELAQAAGIGMTSLPPDNDVLLDKILRAVKTFDGQPEGEGEESFLFVMEDPSSGKIVGTTGIWAQVGLKQPFYSYKINTITQSCSSPEIFSKHQMLQVVNDLTGTSEIGSLFLLPEYRRDRQGRLLSLCRFLFMADFPELFAETVIAEMRGWHDGEGNAPFYNSLARHFFEMEFREADYTNATKGNQFIADLMPKYPIYVSLLPKEAQAVIGKPYASSEPAKALLEKQGFRWKGYVDIFDGGPTMQAERELITTIRDSQQWEVTAIDDDMDAPKYMMTNGKFSAFRCCAGRMRPHGDGVMISPKAAEWLQVEKGDMIRGIEHQAKVEMA